MLPNPSESAGLRVLVVAPEPFYDDRGTPIAVAQVLRALSELGCVVDVLTYPLGSDLPLTGVRWSRIGNPLRFRHVPVGLSFRKVVLDVLLALRLPGMVRRGRYDVIHAVEESAFLATLVGRRAGVPVLYDMQSSIPQQLSRHRVFGLPPSQAFIRRCESWLLSRVNLVVASAGLAEYVRAKAPSARVEEWRYPGAPSAGRPVDVRALRTRLGVPDGAKAVVYLGTFEEYQGLPALVAAASTVVAARPETVFIVVGGDRERVAKIEDLARRSGLTEHFRVLVREPREQALLYLQLADVVVSPRDHGDNLPLKIVDYMAAARPIVATRIAAHTTVLDSSRAVLTSTDGEGIARGILSVLDDEEAAARLAKAAKSYADQHLDWPAFVTAVHGHLQRLVQAPR